MQFCIRPAVLFALAGLVLAPGCARPREPGLDEAVAAYREDAAYGGLTVTYPLDETVFPPDLAAPAFRWQDADPRCDTWVLIVQFADDGRRASFLAHAAEWTPTPEQWEDLKRRTTEKDAAVAVLGFRRSAPGTILSGARLTIRTSQDEVGAPLFYREVNLPFAEAVKDPSKIRWRFGPVSSAEPPPIVLENLPVCGNCHSFSADGRAFGMDVDYANDKGSYAFTAVRPDITLATSEILTWSDFQRADGQATFGLLSQVSPDGRYALSTVKDRSVFVATPELAFSQLFFPIRGILAVYDRQHQTFAALPGADDPDYVQSNPSWSPDGQTVVFARSRAHRLRQDSGNVLLTKEECAEFLDEKRSFLFDLYRIPFQDGAGGTAQPLAGASQNGVSNFFAKYSPDGRWIVFCKARSYMLLQPDSELWIIPAAGGAARRLRCNTGRMNSWHSWSPNGKWLVFSSKANSPYTQLFLTHIDERGDSSPPVCLSRLTAPERAANIPEFVPAAAPAIVRIGTDFVDDLSYVRAGDAFLRGNDPDGAVRQFRLAVARNPHNAIAHNNLGGVLVNQGQLDAGVTHLHEAIRLDPSNGSPYYNLGMLRARQGQSAEAAQHLAQAVRLKPDIADAHRVLGTLLCNQDAVADGVRHMAEAVRLDPKDAVSQYCLGKALLAQNQATEAIAHLTAAVQLESDYVPALALLAQLLFRQGQAAEAEQYLARAIVRQPDDAGLHTDLAFMLALATAPAARDSARAVELAQRACRLTGDQAFAALDVLGISQAAAGDFPAAIQSAARALQLARDAGQDQVAAGIAERLQMYGQGQAYRLPPAP